MGIISLMAIGYYVLARRRIVAADPGLTEGRPLQVDEVGDEVASSPAGAVGVPSDGVLTQIAER